LRSAKGAAGTGNPMPLATGLLLPDSLVDDFGRRYPFYPGHRLNGFTLGYPFLNENWGYEILD